MAATGSTAATTAFGVGISDSLSDESDEIPGGSLSGQPGGDSLNVFQKEISK